MGLFSRLRNTKERLGRAAGRWVDFERHKDVGENIKSRWNDLLHSPSATHTETFEEAQARFHLTDADLEAIASRYTMTAYLLLVWALMVFGYSIYHLLGSYFKGMIVSWGVTTVLLAVAFRYHFWAYQIKQRRLGCTFRSWLWYILGIRHE